MKKTISVLIFCLITAITFGQIKYNLVIQKTSPMLYLYGTGGQIKWTGNITMTQSSGKVTFGGGNLDMGANALLGTGAVGAAGAGKHSKGWFTDLESTNDITINGTALASTYATITALNGKQATLVSASNIKTLNGNSVLGAGDLVISGVGTVTTFSVTTANGISASVANATSTPAATFTLGAITPTSVNGVVLSGSSTPTLAITGTSTISGTNTGNNAVNTLYSSLVSNATHTGDATGSTALTVVKINGTQLSSLSTGLLKNTNGTGVPTIAQAGTDYLLPSGNAATATKLAATKTINGVAFDGSANISVPSNITPGAAGHIMKSTGSLWESAVPPDTISVGGVNNQSGTTYTLAVSDDGGWVLLSNTSAITLTVPPHSSIALPVLAEINIVQMNTGQVTFAEGSGVQILSSDGALSLTGQYAGATLKQISSDIWLLIGKIE